MKFGSLVFGAVCVAGLASLAGCASYPPPGKLVYGRCGMDHHTESYPRARDPKKAYGCKSDDAGFLEGNGQGDRPRD